MALTLKHQTAAQFVARLRAAYRDGDPATLVKIARFLIARLAAGDVTDAQLRAAFGLTAAQWTALKTRMQALLDADGVVQAARGE